VWHTDSLDRTNFSFFFSSHFQSLDPANDSWKNNSENERATTIERFGRGRERERERGKEELDLATR